jgi:dihydrofolate reductase
MGTVTMTTFVSLDGVMQAPGGAGEDPSGGFSLEGWLVPYAEAEFGKFMAEVFTRADAFLLGRRTYEIFASHWPRVTDPNDPIATKLNALPKYVASTTLKTASWNNSVIVRDVAAQLKELKAKHEREIQVHGSGDLAQTLIKHGLVDEYHVLQFPVLLGSGKRLFGSGTVPTALKLVRTITTSTGVTIRTLRPEGAPKVGSFRLPD